MARRLRVDLHGELVGHLTQDDQGRIRFAYATRWLERGDSRPLSRSLPLRPERFNPRETEPFFAGLLPEEEQRTRIARNLGISANNYFAMLAEVGGEIAGAARLISEEASLSESGTDYRPLTPEDLAEILRELPHRPMMAGTGEVRLSLAGAQSKLPIRVDGDNYSLPLGSAPSTHVIKPENERLHGLVVNEAYCMQLAGTVGLRTAHASISRVSDVEFLLVDRYDRVRNAEGEVERLHQEDFCQALGISSVQKYQAEGGPGIADLMRLTREATSTPVTEVAHLLDAVIFNLLIGNNDAHGKNFSLLYRERAVTIAPLYDLVSTAYYPELSLKMAMMIGGANRADDLGREHWERMATSSGLNRTLVLDRVADLAGKVAEAVDSIGIDHPVADELGVQIRRRCEAVQNRVR